MNTNDADGDDKTVVYLGETYSPPAKAKLVCVDKDRAEGLSNLEIPLDDKTQTFGRSEDNSICIKNKKISGKHARLFPENGTWVIEDLNSTNGVFVNERKVTRAPLSQDDIIKIATIPFRYVVESNAQIVQESVPVVTTSHMDVGSTMYAGHPEVLHALASIKEEDPIVEEAPPLPPQENTPSKDSTPEKLWSARVWEHIKNASPRYVLALFLVGGLIGGYYLYPIFIHNQEIENLVTKYDPERNLSKLKDESKDPDQEITTMVEGINKAIQDYPNSQLLKEVQAKLLFLEFEQKLNEPIEHWLEEAANQVEALDKTVRTSSPHECDKNNKKGAVRGKRNAIQKVCELFELARVVIQFKLFSQAYPDPVSSASRPSPQYVDEILTLRKPLMANLKKNQFILKTLYTNFQRLVRETEENDLRLANRWKEIVKDTPSSTEILPTEQENTQPLKLE